MRARACVSGCVAHSLGLSGSKAGTVLGLCTIRIRTLSVAIGRDGGRRPTFLFFPPSRFSMHLHILPQQLCQWTSLARPLMAWGLPETYRRAPNMRWTAAMLAVQTSIVRPPHRVDAVQAYGCEPLPEEGRPIGVRPARRAHGQADTTVELAQPRVRDKRRPHRNMPASENGVVDNAAGDVHGASPRQRLEDSARAAHGGWHSARWRDDTAPRLLKQYLRRPA